MNWESNVRKVTPYTPGEQPKFDKMVKLNTNECPYPPAPGVLKAMQDLPYADLRLYPDVNGGLLHRALADYHKVDPSRVFVGVGSDDVIATAFQAFFNSQKPLLFPDITYSFYPVWADLYRIPYQTPALDENFRIRREDYLQENGGIIFPNPNAPTGVAEDLSLIEDIVRANPDSVVIIDEAYVDFGAETALPLTERYENLLVIRTFSKSRAMAGLRIGYAIGSSKLIKYLNDVKFSINSYTMNLPSQLLGAASVKDDAYFREVLGKVIRTRENMKKALADLGFTFPDSKSNFIFATHKSVPAENIFKTLREQQIFVRYFKLPRIDNYLRISVGTDEDTGLLINALSGIPGIQ